MTRGNKNQRADPGEEVFEGVQDLVWKTPPDDVLERARKLEVCEVLPEPDPDVVEECRPTDVRAAASALDSGDEIMITRSHDDADLTLTIQPPDQQGEWKVAGRIWLRTSDAAKIKVALVHEEHVLCTKAVASGEYFEIEEALPRHWHLEVHMPSGACLRVDDLLP